VRVIAGLGNPGDEYRSSRHNAGVLVVAGLARAHRIRLAVGAGDFASGTGRIAGQEALLVLPRSYMNESGPALASALCEANAGAADLLVVCDDVNLPLGQLRLRLSGSDGGHRGLRSIIETLGTEAFPRLRLGVGAAPVGEDMVDHVLGDFGEAEREIVREMVLRAVEAIEFSLARGFEIAMSVYNRRERPPDACGPEEGS